MTSPQIVYTVGINELPPELLGEIFVLCIDLVPCGKENTNDYIIESSSEFAPFLLVHVCRYWRAVMFSMQNLWTSFYCYSDTFAPEALAYWLRFSGSSPVRLGLSPESINDDEIDSISLKASKDLLRQFAGYSHRWDTLLFDSEYLEVTEAFTDLLYNTTATAPTSSLRSLEICMCHDDTPVMLIIRLAVAIGSFHKSLRHFAWTFNSSEFTHIPRVVPWDVLESVYVDAYANVEDFIWCLEHCTSARTVTLLGKRGNRGLKQTGDVLLFSDTHGYRILPKLESLTINEYCDPVSLFRSFTLASLASLTIRTIHGSSITLALQDFFVRSRCPLQRFVVEESLRSTMTENEIIGCLATPYLRSVPEVVLTVWHDREPWLTKAVAASQHLLKEMPARKNWSSGVNNAYYHLGWRRDVDVAETHDG